MKCSNCPCWHPDEWVIGHDDDGPLWESSRSYCHWRKGQEPAPCERTRAMVKRFVVCHGAGMSETDDYTEARLIAKCIGGGRSWMFDTPLEPTITDNDADAIWYEGHWV